MGRWEVLSKRLKNVGEEYKSSVEVPREEHGKNYPTVHEITEKMLPELKGAKVGDAIKFIGEGKISRSSKRNNDPTQYSIEIQKLGIVKGTKEGNNE